VEGKERVTVTDAAALLGTTEGALRKRIARGTLPHERDAEGRVWVLLDAGTQREDTGQLGGQDSSGLVDELRDRVAYLERQVEEEREARRRADIMLSRLMDRLPELEAPREGHQESPGGQERAPEGQDASEARVGREEATRAPWWRRWFGG
jgi:hypothetical protein